MSSDSETFAAWLDDMRPALAAWGRFVVGTICALVKEEIGEEAFGKLLKVAPASRVKETPSALAKLANKPHYQEPREQMTDLVGARFVVLLRSDVAIIEHAVVSFSGWVRSKDRDPQEEQGADPSAFDYQSVHYVLKNSQERNLEGHRVPEGLACEVQIRTLLQHAYAELVHDKFYKGSGHIPVSARRLVARSMALMETTDDMFCAAVQELDRVNRSREQWCAWLDLQLGAILGTFTPTGGDEDALEVIDAYKEQLKQANTAQVAAMLTPALAQRIRARASQGGLFAKPVVLLVYWLVRNHPYEVGPMWPLAGLQTDFEQVKSDLGSA